MATVKTNLASPTRPKIRRKSSAEPTMTIHTKEAHNDILDIFNQPLRNVRPIGEEDADAAGEESDYDEDDYTSAGESTGTGRISGATSEAGDVDDETRTRNATTASGDLTEAKSASEWSDFTRSKHMPRVHDGDESTETAALTTADNTEASHAYDGAADDDGALAAPTSPTTAEVAAEGEPVTKFVPIPPEDFETPIGTYRDSAQRAQSRLPFMTPIVEKTESSFHFATNKDGSDGDRTTSKTPCPARVETTEPPIAEMEDLLIQSPLQEIVNEATPARKQPPTTKTPAATTSAPLPPQPSPPGPIVTDSLVLPTDPAIRATILAALSPPLSTDADFHDHRADHPPFARAPELRRFSRALAKSTSRHGGSSSSSAERTPSVPPPPVLRFPAEPDVTYTVRRELGAGAFAPVYLCERRATPSPSPTDASHDSAAAAAPPELVALKCESPPAGAAWEYHVLRLARARLARTRHAAALVPARALHLFPDEGYLVERYHGRGTLLDLVNLARNEPGLNLGPGGGGGGGGGGAGGLDEALAMYFAVETLRAVDALHGADVLHGDVKADNVLVRLPSLPSPSSAPLIALDDNNDSEDEGSGAWDARYAASGAHGWAARGVALIDFGRAIDRRAFAPRTQFVADWPTDAGDCVEARAMRPWTAQADYWGAAGVAHVLLFGKPIADVPERAGGGNNGNADGAEGGAEVPRRRLRESLRRYWQTELWAALFDVLMNPTAWVVEADGGRLPCRTRVGEVLGAMERWLEENAERRGLQGMLRRLEERTRGERGKGR